MATEYLLSINKFDRPKKYVDSEGKPAATQTLITRLILMDPGTIQHHPDMGVGIVSRYRYSNTDDLPALRHDIEDQCHTYLPELYDCTVEVELYDSHTVRIMLLSNDIKYVADFDKETLTLSEL